MSSTVRARSVSSAKHCVMPNGDLRGPHAIDDATWSAFLAWGADRGIVHGNGVRLTETILRLLLDAAADYDALLSSLDGQTALEESRRVS